MARQKSGSLYSLQGLVEQDRTGHLCGELHHPWLPGYCSGNGRSYYGCADSDRPVLPVLYPHAVLHTHGENQASSRKGDRMMRKLIFGLVFAILPAIGLAAGRSEERRVGKEWSCWLSSASLTDR